jgi:hypothetical protein
MVLRQGINKFLQFLTEGENPMKKQIFTWAMIIVLVPLLACSLGGGGDEGASSQASLGGEDSEEAAATQAPVVEDIEEVTEETPTPAPTPEPESAEFTGVMGIEEFDSYQANILLEFTGATGEAFADVATDQTQETFLEVIQEPDIWHQEASIKSTGAFDVDLTTEYYYIDDVTYTLSFDTWTAQDGLAGRVQFSHPSLVAPLPETALCNTEPETVNDISVIYCTFTEEDNVANSLDAANIEGEVWIAEDGGYVVKYILDAEEVDLKGAFSGGYEYFETYKIEYEISNVNGDIAINLPAEAQGTALIDTAALADDDASGIPAPDGAEVFIDSFASLLYFSTLPLEDLADFHVETVPTIGYQEIPEESYVDEGYALLIFEDEEGGILRTFIQRDLGDDGYFVTVTLPFENPNLSPGGQSDSSSAGTGVDVGEFPVLDDAEEITSLGGFITYYSAADISSTVDFYRNEMSAEGWAEDEAQTLIQPDTLGMMQFTKEGETVMVTVTKEDDGRTNVIVVAQ